MLGSVQKESTIRGALDFSTLSGAQRDRVERYVGRLTPAQRDRLAAMSPGQASAIITGAESHGLGFFWWIIEAAYAIKVAADAKKKKAAADKKTAEVKKKAKAAIDKEKAQLAMVNKQMTALDKLQGSMMGTAPGAPSAVPDLIGVLAIGGVILYLIKRKTRNA